MIFDEIIGLEEVPEGEKVIYRKAVRAVIFNAKNQLVMVQVKEHEKDDYQNQFPGGGLEAGESHLETLRREALEEAGIIIKEDVELLGVMEERRKSREVADAYFVMKSTYYRCDVEAYTDQQLEDYEKELGFIPIEIDIKEAYEKNVAILQEQESKNPFTQRDTFVLKSLLAKMKENG